MRANSGLSADDFAAGKGYRGASLRWAVSQLEVEKMSRSGSASDSASKRARRRPAGESRRPAEETSSSGTGRAPRFVPVRMQHSVPAVAEMVIEVGMARIRMMRGMDVALLGEVVRALQGVAR